jgi:hypothetical protein
MALAKKLGALPYSLSPITAVGLAVIVKSYIGHLVRVCTVADLAKTIIGRDPGACRAWLTDPAKICNTRTTASLALRDQESESSLAQTR